MLDPCLLRRQIAELRAQLQNEANRSIRKNDLHFGIAALGGIDALDRLENRIGLGLVQVFAGASTAEPALERRIKKRRNTVNISCRKCGKRFWPGNFNVHTAKFCRDCRPAIKRERERARREAKRVTRTRGQPAIVVTRDAGSK